MGALIAFVFVQCIRRICDGLNDEDYVINRKRIQRLMCLKNINLVLFKNDCFSSNKKPTRLSVWAPVLFLDLSNRDLIVMVSYDNQYT